jgi:hypothetical protein
MSNFMREVKLAAKEAPRVYFAPLVGAVREMRRQVQLLEAARRQQRSQHTGPAKTTRPS